VALHRAGADGLHISRARPGGGLPGQCQGPWPPTLLWPLALSLLQRKSQFCSGQDEGNKRSLPLPLKTELDSGALLGRVRGRAGQAINDARGPTCHAEMEAVDVILQRQGLLGAAETHHARASSSVTAPSW